MSTAALVPVEASIAIAASEMPSFLIPDTFPQARSRVW
jgi:hypothetical protein